MRGDRTRVLVISPQFPFPATWGFATRVHELAKQLVARADVTLLTYAGAADRDNVARLRDDFDVAIVPHEPVAGPTKRARQLLSLGSHEPFQCRVVHTTAMQRAIDEWCATGGFDFVQLESS